MKRFVVISIGLMLLVASLSSFSNPGVGRQDGSPEAAASLRILASQDLFPVAMAWAGDYLKRNPEADIRVVNEAEWGNTSAAGGQDVYLVSGSLLKDMQGGESMNLVVGREPLVPVIHSNNPYRDQILAGGITQSDFKRLFTATGGMTWGDILGGGHTGEVTAYYAGGDGLAGQLAGFLDVDPSAISALSYNDAQQLMVAISNDPFAIGFCRLNGLVSADQAGFLPGILPVPIDRNANGKADHFEQIYASVPQFIRGIWIGKYPRELCGNIYARVNHSGPEVGQTEFLRYLLSDGQKLMVESGLTGLTGSERLSALEKLPGGAAIMVSSKVFSTGVKTALIISGAAILMLLIFWVIRYGFGNLVSAKNQVPSEGKVISQNSVEVPGGLFFDKSHTWAIMEPDGKVRVGIDDFLQRVTGPVTRIRMKKSGEQIRKGEPFLTLIQKGKQLEISSPVTGIIRSENDILYNDPSLLNSFPYSKGWVYTIEPVHWMRETQIMLMANRYKEWLQNEFSQLRDFLTTAVYANKLKYGHLTLPDGGEIADGVLAGLGPEVWEEFQSQFLNHKN